MTRGAIVTYLIIAAVMAGIWLDPLVWMVRRAVA